MASIKSTFYSILALGVLLAVVAGGVFGWRFLQARQIGQTMDQARALLKDGKPLDADRLLNTRLAAARPDEPWVADAVAMRLEALDAANDPGAEEALAQTVLNPDKPWVQPGQEGWARAQLAVGEAAMKAGQASAASQAFQAILARPAGTWGREAAQFGMDKVKLASPATFMEGWQELTDLQGRLQDGALRSRVEKLLGDANMKLLMDRDPHGNDQIYVIARNDTIDGMSRKNKVSKELLMRVNGISDPKLLTIGRRIKIPDLDLSIVVNKADNTLTLFNHGKFFKKYRVRTGESEYMTPVGDFTIGRKTVNPTWSNPKTKQKFEAGDPGNELGVRWMGFQENPSIGIHEAVDPTSVGKYGSNGCVGLVQADILELYDLCRVGTPVKIIGERSSGLALPSALSISETPSPPAAATPTPPPSPAKDATP